MAQARVDRFLSSPQRVDVGMIGGEAGRHLGTLGNGPVAVALSAPTTWTRRRTRTAAADIAAEVAEQRQALAVVNTVGDAPDPALTRGGPDDHTGLSPVHLYDP